MSRRTAHERGLGAAHQRRRTALINAHRDGTPCWWCGAPMYREPTHNPDREPLHADHSTARAHGGTRADRLLHARCNRERRTGEHDALRPAVTGRPLRDTLADIAAGRIPPPAGLEYLAEPTARRTRTPASSTGTRPAPHRAPMPRTGEQYTTNAGRVYTARYSADGALATPHPWSALPW